MTSPMRYWVSLLKEGLAVSAVKGNLMTFTYEEVMEKAYPRGADGTVLFPFRRLFFTLTV